MITNRQQAFKPLLQWLWAVHHKDVIPITPIQQSPGEREQQKKIVTHQIHIFWGLAPPNILTPLQGTLLIQEQRQIPMLSSLQL